MPMEVTTIALPLAHAGHYALYVLYAVPVLVVIGSILLSVIRDRRARRDGITPQSPAP
jgi:heme exporter protein D